MLARKRDYLRINLDRINNAAGHVRGQVLWQRETSAAQNHNATLRGHLLDKLRHHTVIVNAKLEAQFRRNVAHGLERAINVEQPNGRTVGVFGVKNHRETKFCARHKNASSTQN